MCSEEVGPSFLFVRRTFANTNLKQNIIALPTRHRVLAKPQGADIVFVKETALVSPRGKRLSRERKWGET